MQCFKELEVWKRGRRIRQEILLLLREFPVIERYALGMQMRRAAISITANIAEGYGRRSWKENIRFCRISRGSAYELRDHLTTAFDENYLDGEELARLDRETVVFIKQLNSYIGGMVRRSQKGQGSST